MAIKIYSASADTTITNAYKPDLVTRGTGSNMGFADVLEVFSIAGQASASSDELSRSLLKFPVHEISASRAALDIPKSGSVDFYLRLYNTPHTLTLPKNFTLEVRPLTRAFEEGTGMDMDEYRDETYELEGANWLYASSGTTWTVPGGDFKDDDHDNRAFYQTFEEGIEDLEIDITELVEEWMGEMGGTDGGHGGTARTNYGLLLKLSGAHEAYFSSSVITSNDGDIGGAPNNGSRLHNLTGSDDSFYTKKFFARSSQYFFKTPRIEARWDSSIRDDSANFYVSSALAPELDNVNTIYLYNYVRGQLQNIPTIGDSLIYVSLHTGSSPSNLDPVACEIKHHTPGGGTSAAFKTFATGGWVDTGIYSASVVVTSSLSSNNYYFPVWATADGGTELFTGSAITAQKFDTRQGNPSPTYVSAMPNLKREYTRKETARLRLAARDRDWCPTIYTVAKKEQQDIKIIENAYYRVFREVDEYEVIPYGTGSSTTPQAQDSAESYTRLSFDVSGNYFDFDMSLLEAGYSYGLQYTYYVNGSWKEQPETFKFRVEE